jgi:hypothetical protein
MTSSMMHSCDESDDSLRIILRCGLVYGKQAIDESGTINKLQLSHVMP